jgi:ribosomal protein S18 acetylase RimI-like enzyme
MTTKIRPWQDADIETIRTITWETWVAAYSAFIPVEDLRTYFDRAYAASALKELQAQSNVDGYVAEIGGETVVGYLKTHLEKAEGRFYVSSVYVLPSYQGMGIGGMLMKAAEERAIAAGMHEVWLGVMVQNTPALDWYRRNGFEFVEEAPFTMGKTTVNHLIGFRKLEIQA